MKQKIVTDAAPKPSGTYSQAIQVGNTIYLAGQVALDPYTGELVSDDFATQAKQVFMNLQAVCLAAGGTIDNIVKLTIYITHLGDFALVNDTMAHFFKEPYPARTTIQVSGLPKNAKIEVEAVMVV